MSAWTRVLVPLLALLALGGCRSTPWVRGGISEGMPKLERRFPRDVAFFVERTEPRVHAAFVGNLRARGFAVAEKEEDSDVVLRAKVDAWEFNDAGFGGRTGARDDMELSVVLVDRRRGRILARAGISVRSDFRIIAKYVEKF